MPAHSSSAVSPESAIELVVDPLDIEDACMQLPHDRTRADARLGGIVKSLFTTLCGAGLLITAAAVLDPATIQAGSTPPPQPTIARSAHQEFMRSLGSMIEQCEAVLVVRSSQDDRGAEIVLWLDDASDRGRINAHELALLRHSPLFRTLTLYSVSPSAAGSARSADPVALDRDAIAAPGFIDRWRAMSAVQARVLATGVSDMRVEGRYEGVEVSRWQGVMGSHDMASDSHSTPRHLGTSTPVSFLHELSPVRIHLRWEGDSVDGPDEASISCQPSADR